MFVVFHLILDGAKFVWCENSVHGCYFFIKTPTPTINNLAIAKSSVEMNLSMTRDGTGIEPVIFGVRRTLSMLYPQSYMCTI